MIISKLNVTGKTLDLSWRLVSPNNLLFHNAICSRPVSYSHILSQAAKSQRQLRTSCTISASRESKQCQLKLPVFSALFNSSRYSSQKIEGKFSSNLSKDVILFKHENANYHRLLNLFGFTMWCVGITSAWHFLDPVVTPTSEDKVNHSLSWFGKDLFESNVAKYVISALSGLIGCMCLVGSWGYTMRTVCFLILRKGGKEVTFVTYQPLGLSKHWMVTANISDVSCHGSRGKSDVLPIKVKGKWMHFLLYKEGEFVNAALFDKTVGYNRGF